MREIATQHALNADAEGRHPAEAVQALRESGLLAPAVPREADGLGGGPHELFATVGGPAGVCGSTEMIYLMHLSAVMPVAVAPPPGCPSCSTSSPTAECSPRWPPPRPARARTSRPRPGSKATCDGDTVALMACKSWVPSVGKADIYVVSTGLPDVDGGVDLFAVPADTPGSRSPGPGRAWASAATPMLYILGVDSATSDAAMRVCGGARSWERAAAGIRAAPGRGVPGPVARSTGAGTVLRAGTVHGVPRLPRYRPRRPGHPRARAPRRLRYRSGAHRRVPDPGDDHHRRRRLYWLVTRGLFLLADVIAEVERRFVAHRSKADAAAQWFPCA